MLYLDWNATTPPHPDVLAAMHDAAGRAWGNPSSLHRAGRAAKAFVEGAREAIGDLTGFCARDVVFTSGGTEANNLGLMRPFLGPNGIRKGVCVTSRLEHPSVTRVAEWLEAQGVSVAWLEVPSSGRLDPVGVERALASALPGPRLVAVQAVNHETGVVQPVGAIAEVAHRHDAEVHVDAVQAVGRLEPEAWLGADTLAVAAHKMRGPKGIGALAGRAGIVVRPVLRGGAQERGLRPGTVDPVAAAGFGVAARRAASGSSRYTSVTALRDHLERSLLELGQRSGAAPLRNGDGGRAPHVSNLSWPGWSGDELVAALDLEGVCVSAGSACAAGTPEPSRVIAAMAGEERARGAVRVSLGEDTTAEDVISAIRLFERVLARHC
ncbi:MAG TPA: cysteine desulfurase family protein [Polyangiaceae bacterium]|nr:cysteine desulfurase family protein [Polyangiaceae bacterium]